VNLRLYRLLLIGLLLLAATLRLWGLDRDPPPYDVLPDAAPWTDEGTIGLPAVEAARGDVTLSAALADGTRPVQRLVLYGAFELIGPGQAQGRLVSTLFGLMGLAALAALSATLWPTWGPLLTLLVGGTGFYFVAYDRLLLTEGPLIALMSLLTLAGLRTRSRPAALATGAGVALLTAGFKLHAIALLPALGLLYALRRRRLLLPLLAGCAIPLLAWRLLFVAQTAPSYPAYLDQRLSDGRLGLVSALTAVQQLFDAGLPAYFLTYQIPLLILASVEGLAFLLSPRRWLRQAKDAEMVALVWLAAIMLGDSLFRYLPPRYFHIASPALLLFAVSGARRVWSAVPFPESREEVRVLAAVTASWFLIYQTIAPVKLFGRPALWMALTGIALILALFVGLGARRRPGSRFSAVLVGALLLLQIITQGSLYYRGIALSRPDLAQANAAMASMLPPDAVITGRLAGTLALSGSLHGVPNLDNVSLSFLQNLAAQQPVWVLVLQRDEFLIDPKAWPYLFPDGAFPVDYGSGQQRVTVYRFDRQAALSAPSN
jgi:hypothetical protein